LSRKATTKTLILALAAGSAIIAGSAFFLTSSEQRAEASIKTDAPTAPALVRAKSDGKQDQNKAPAERPAPRKLANGTRIGAWTVRCEAVAVGETACALVQQLLRPSDRAFIAEIVAAWNGSARKPVLVARVPMGVHLPSGFVIQAKGDRQRNFVWQRCFGRFCEATLVLSPEDAAKLEGAGEVVAAFRPAPGTNPFVFRFSMKGLRQGLEALGVDPAALAASPSPAGEDKDGKKKKK